MATLQDLISQKESLEREIERLKEQSRGEAIEKVRALMAEYDLSLADIGVRGAAKTSPQTQAKPRKKAPAGKVPAKFRDTATGQTWSGRGLQPRWLKAALESGRKLSDFAV